MGRNKSIRAVAPRAVLTAAAAVLFSVAAAYAGEDAAAVEPRPFEATREWVAEAALEQGLYPAGMAEAPAEVWEPYAEALVALQGWDLEVAEKALRRARGNVGRAPEGIAVNHALSELYFKKADLKNAFKYADEALALARAERDKKAESYLLKDLAKIEQLGGNIPKALDYSRRGCELSAELQDPPLRAYYLLCIAELALEFGDDERASGCLEEAASMFGDVGSEWALARIDFYRGFLNIKRGEYEEGKETVEGALETFVRGGDRHSEAQARGVIGLAWMVQGDWDAAILEFMPALEIYRELDDRACEAKALYMCAQVFREWKQNDSALTAVEEALAVSREYRMAPLETLCTVERGVLSLAVGDLKGAEKSFKEASKQYKKTGDPAGERTCDWALALFYVAQGKNDKALKKLGDLERRCVAAKDRKLLVAVYAAAAEAYEGKLDLESARAYRAKLVALREEQGNERGLAEALSAQAYTFLKSCFYERALEGNRRAIALYDKWGDARGAAFNYRGAGVCYMRTGQHEEAVKAFEEAAELHHELGDGFELGKDYLYLGLLAGKVGNENDKTKFMEEARRLINDKPFINSVVALEAAFVGAERAGIDNAVIYGVNVGGKTVIIIGK